MSAITTTFISSTALGADELGRLKNYGYDFLADAKGFFVFHKGANYFMISDAESYEKAGPSNTCVVAMLLPNTKIKDGDHAEIKYSPNWR